MPAGGGSRSRALAEGAMLAALTVALSLLTAYVPMAGLLSVPLLPTPAVVLVMRHDVRTAVLSSLAAAIILFTFIGPVGALLGWLHVAGIGIPLGLGMKRRWPAAWTMAMTTGTFLLLAAISVAVSLLVSGFNPITLSVEAYREAGARAYELYSRVGLLPPGADTREAFLELWDAMISAMVTLLPVAFVGAYAMFSVLTYNLNRAVLARLGHADVPPVTPFARWRLPVWMVYAYAGLSAALFGLDRLGWRPPDAVTLNVVYAFVTLFLVNGAATAYALLRGWRLTRGPAILLIVTVFMMGGGLVLVWLGLLEPVLRLRDRYLPHGSDGEEEDAGEGDPETGRQESREGGPGD